MKDKELYDFFKEREQVFDEAPGDALWSQIESRLEPGPVNVSRFPLRMLFSGLIAVTAIISVFLWYNRHEETPIPGNMPNPSGIAVKEDTKVEAVDAEIEKALPVTDSVKKKKPLRAIADNSPAPALTSIVETAVADTVKFDPDAVKAEIRKEHNRLMVNVKQRLTTVQFDLFTARIMRESQFMSNTLVTIKAPGQKPFRQMTSDIDPKLRDSEVEMKRVYISYIQDTLPTKSEKINVESTPSLIDTFKSNPPRLNTVEKVLFTPIQSKPGTDSIAIKAKVKIKPAEVTFTIEGKPTQKHFNLYKEKVIRESDYPAGTIIIITAPGYKPYRYIMPEIPALAP